MLEASGLGVLATIVSIALAVACAGLSAVYVRVAARTPARSIQAGNRRMVVAGGATATSSTIAGRQGAGSPGGIGMALGAYTMPLAGLGFVFLTVGLALRTIATGHGPFANMYEFSLAFGWGMLGAYLYFDRRYRVGALGLIALPVALALLLYAATLPAAAAPLVPALQNSLLLTVHVACAVVAYGSFAVAFAAGLLYLVGSSDHASARVDRDSLDDMSYRSVVVGFPFLTLTIVLGAIWADVAWGSYWSWDPKETASLVTWLIYAAYLHARVVRGWKGERAAGFLVAGFAAILFTFLGNLFFGGMHSYSGLS